MGRRVVALIVVGLVAVVVELAVPALADPVPCIKAGAPCCNEGGSLICIESDLVCNTATNECESCGDIGELCCAPPVDMSSPGTAPSANGCVGGLVCRNGRCDPGAPALSGFPLSVLALSLGGLGYWLMRRRHTVS